MASTEGGATRTGKPRRAVGEPVPPRLGEPRGVSPPGDHSARAGSAAVEPEGRRGLPSPLRHPAVTPPPVCPLSRASVSEPVRLRMLPSPVSPAAAGLNAGPRPAARERFASGGSQPTWRRLPAHLAPARPWRDRCHLSGCSAPACRTPTGYQCECGPPSGSRTGGCARPAPGTAAPRGAAAWRPAPAPRAATGAAAAGSWRRAWRESSCGPRDNEAQDCRTSWESRFSRRLGVATPPLPRDVGVTWSP